MPRRNPKLADERTPEREIDDGRGGTYSDPGPHAGDENAARYEPDSEDARIEKRRVFRSTTESKRAIP